MTAATPRTTDLPPIPQGDPNPFSPTPIPAPFPGDVDAAPQGPTLSDAELGGAPASAEQVAAADPPMTNEQIIGLVAQLSAFGLPPELAAAYAADFTSNPLVQLGVQFAGLADALAEYGLTSGSGKLPAWMSVLLGVGVLGYGVYTTRGKYAPHTEPAAAAPGTPGAFGIAGGGTPLQATDLGYGGAADAGSGASASF